MFVEVRVELFSRKWKEILRFWKHTGSQVQLSGVLGSVVGIFREDSPDYAILQEFADDHRHELGIRTDESRRAVYSLAEKRGCDLLVIFCQTAFGAVPLIENYQTQEPCPECGNTPPPDRIGPMVLTGSDYLRFRVFLTEANEVVVNSDIRAAIETKGLSGAKYQQCYSLDGSTMAGYFQLLTESNLGPRLIRDGESLACSCGQWNVHDGITYPPEFIYRRYEWDGNDLVFSGDRPSLFTGSPGLIDVLDAHEHSVSWDQCLPIHLI